MSLLARPPHSQLPQLPHRCRRCLGPAWNVFPRLLLLPLPPPPRRPSPLPCSIQVDRFASAYFFILLADFKTCEVANLSELHTKVLRNRREKTAQVFIFGDDDG